MKKIVKPKINFNLSLGNFLNLLKLSISKPRVYAEAIPNALNYQKPLLFFTLMSVTEATLSLILDVIIKQNASVLFLGISSIVLSIPISLLSVLISSTALFWLSRFLGGKSGFKTILGAFCYSSLPSIFSFIPYLSLLSGILTIYILIVAIKNLSQLSYLKASVTVIFPTILASIIFIMLGLRGILHF